MRAARPPAGLFGLVRTRALIWILLALVLAPSSASAKEDAVVPAPEIAVEEPTTATVPQPEPEDYRTEAYRAPVPASLAGGTVVDTAAAKTLHDEGAAFVDVLPRAPRPKGLPADTIWRPKPRSNIPGSIWLVDTGYGELAPAMERYLIDGLVAVTQGDKSRPVVIYCLRDCWMSYNAAKRAIRAGFAAVYWYPDGTDGWAEAGYALAPSEPEPRPDE
ncbi:PQQ-dependent catabolism-associated CXXCW motif protein [Aurantimonas sp. C2-6-R+9]|uniref:PQQ-dependent catabolism-associated CXXCW motif protein n=1 Tax=unclassified Aurantimonas TaxID=2638230 RepID=UPI002E184C4F|nr:PQQ-dependent catabolism-associated CXXCW motif protein [Aurantimonas sp. C2-6-R+9]